MLQDVKFLASTTHNFLSCNWTVILRVRIKVNFSIAS